MSGLAGAAEPPPGDQAWRMLEAAVARLEELYRTEGTADLSQLLPPSGSECRSWILAKLIEVDQECRRRAGQPKPWEAYFNEWPELLNSPGPLQEPRDSAVAGTTRLPSTPRGRGPDPKEDRPPPESPRQPRLLHVRCPHCRNPIELADDAPLAEIVCNACGSSFSLVGDAALAYQTVGGSLRRRHSFGHFDLREELGSGAFGVVWRAHDSQLDRIVALKIPRKGQLDQEETKQFLREARAAAQLKHPNIVTVHEVGVEGDRLYIVSEFVEGVSLHDWLTAKGFTFHEAAALCAKIASAVHFAHDHHVIHRDLKPSNILIDGMGEPHIMDFGLAKREVGEITMTADGQVLGTPAYMSPEQARGEAHAVDRATDIYSLGAILFELLTGVLPFRGAVRMLIKQVIEDPPPSPRKLDHRIPRDLETICLKCLEKDPRRRYETAEELAEDLRRFLARQPILARPVGKITRCWRWCERKPAIAGLAAAVLAALIGGSAVSLYFASKAGLRAKEAIAAKREAEANATEAERGLYFNCIAWAQQKCLADNVLEAQNLLNRCPERLRHWEWKYLKRLCDSDLMTLRGHTRGVRALAFSPDGSKIVSGGADRTIRVWDASTGKELFSGPWSLSEIQSVAFSPDGQRIAAGGLLGITIWDVRNKKASRKLGPSGIVVFSPDGKWIASRLQNDLSLLEAGTAKKIRVLSGHADWIEAAAFASDSTRVASASRDKTVKIWEVTTGRELATLQGHSERVTSVAFSPDSKRIVSGSLDATTRVWDIATRKDVMTLRGHSEGVTTVAMSSDGKWIASGSSDKTVRVWDAVGGQASSPRRGHAGAVNAVRFSPDGRRIVSASEDGTLKVWNSVSSDDAKVLQDFPRDVACVAISADGRYVASGGDDATVRIWETATGKLLRVLSKGGHVLPVQSVAFSPNGRQIASTGVFQIKVWEIGNGELILSRSTAGGIAAFSPNGKSLALAAGATMIVLDAVTGRETYHWSANSGLPSAMAFSPDSERIALGTAEGTAEIWDPAKSRVRATCRGHSGKVTSLVFSPARRRLISASEDGTIKVWDAAAGTELLTLRGHQASVTCLAVSPDENRIISGGVDRTIRLWDMSSGQEVLTLREHSASVLAIACIAGGSGIASVSQDGILRVRL